MLDLVSLILIPVLNLGEKITYGKNWCGYCFFIVAEGNDCYDFDFVVGEMFNVMISSFLIEEFQRHANIIFRTLSFSLKVWWFCFPRLVA